MRKILKEELYCSVCLKQFKRQEVATKIQPGEGAVNVNPVAIFGADVTKALKLKGGIEICRECWKSIIEIDNNCSLKKLEFIQKKAEKQGKKR